MNTKVLRMQVGFVLMISITALVYGQTSTIPDRLRAAGTSLVGQTGVPSGPPPAFVEILRDADIIVRGFVGNPTSYLSEDQREVLTDFPITHSEILYQRPSERTPAKATLTVTLVGGTVTIGALSYTSRHDALPLLDPQSECLLLLKRRDGKFYVAGTYYGAFDIGEGRVRRLTKKQGFAAEYDDGPASEAAADMVGRLRVMRKEVDQF